MSKRLWANTIRTDTCWLWTGAKQPTRYGVWTWRENGKNHGTPAHRKVYEMLVGPIPEGLEADHLCRNRSCVNPDHLEFVTHQENARRRPTPTHCPRGHPYGIHGARYDNGRQLRCRLCYNERQRRYRANRVV